MGIGGLVNISQGAKTIVYRGAFTAGGLKVATGDGQLPILTEGKHHKFVDTVEQISFSGPYATKFGQRVVYVTERAVFELREGGLTLIEIARRILDVFMEIYAITVIAGLAGAIGTFLQKRGEETKGER